jgi:hypothetical protein
MNYREINKLPEGIKVLDENGKTIVKKNGVWLNTDKSPYKRTIGADVQAYEQRKPEAPKDVKGDEPKTESKASAKKKAPAKKPAAKKAPAKKTAKKTTKKK